MKNEFESINMQLSQEEALKKAYNDMDGVAASVAEFSKTADPILVEKHQKDEFARLAKGLTPEQTSTLHKEFNQSVWEQMPFGIKAKFAAEALLKQVETRADMTANRLREIALTPDSDPRQRGAQRRELITGLYRDIQQAHADLLSRIEDAYIFEMSKLPESVGGESVTEEYERLKNSYTFQSVYDSLVNRLRTHNQAVAAELSELNPGGSAQVRARQ